ncbi:MAG: MBL fold metallo-hydrolase, partial [Verrucomicrobiota bacterium]
MGETETFGFDDLIQVRATITNFYVLRDGDELYLIDAGFIRGRTLLRHALKKHGWDQLPIRGIIVTHGHLDHILHVGRVAEETGAWIAAPRLDEAHYAGRPQYSGWAHIVGALENFGRPALGFRRFTPNRFLDDGDEIDVWHGLTTVHLPGHTLGHSGYYCEKLKWLFCADLFASYASWPHLPPAI